MEDPCHALTQDLGPIGWDWCARAPHSPRAGGVPTDRLVVMTWPSFVEVGLVAADGPLSTGGATRCRYITNPVNWVPCASGATDRQRPTRRLASVRCRHQNLDVAIGYVAQLDGQNLDITHRVTVQVLDNPAKFTCDLVDGHNQEKVSAEQPLGYSFTDLLFVPRDR